MKRAALIALLAAASGFAPVHAASLNAQETLQQFNLVVIGNANSSSHVDGRSFIGGSLSGGDYGQNGGGTPASAYAGLTVMGNAGNLNVNGLGVTVLGNLSNANVNAGPSAVQGNSSSVNFNGPSYIGGTKTGTNQNGGPLSPAAAAAAFANAGATDFDAVLTGLSGTLGALGGNSFVTLSGNKAVFNATAVDGVAVFDLTAIDTAVFAKGEFEFNLGGATTVIINSDETSASISANFLGGSAHAIGARTIWNFYNATSLNLNNQFGGSVLAINAHLTNSNNIEGGVYVDRLTQRGEIHLQSFTGNITTPVPEPEIYAMMAAGLGLMGFAARRRRPRAQSA